MSTASLRGTTCITPLMSGSPRLCLNASSDSISFPYRYCVSPILGFMPSC